MPTHSKASAWFRKATALAAIAAGVVSLAVSVHAMASTS
jgi:3-deoxy-D-arabino-heptulosonate 7-phosphate (DAHP) synthase